LDVCPEAPDNEQLNKGTEADVTSTWSGIGEVSGEMYMPICAKLTDPSKEQLQLHLKKRKLRFERFESD